MGDGGDGVIGRWGGVTSEAIMHHASYLSKLAKHAKHRCSDRSKVVHRIARRPIRTCVALVAERDIDTYILVGRPTALSHSSINQSYSYLQDHLPPT